MVGETDTEIVRTVSEVEVLLQGLDAQLSVADEKLASFQRRVSLMRNGTLYLTANDGTGRRVLTEQAIAEYEQT